MAKYFDYFDEPIESKNGYIEVDANSEYQFNEDFIYLVATYQVVKKEEYYKLLYDLASKCPEAHVRKLFVKVNYRQFVVHVLHNMLKYDIVNNLIVYFDHGGKIEFRDSRDIKHWETLFLNVHTKLGIIDMYNNNSKPMAIDVEDGYQPHDHEFSHLIASYTVVNEEEYYKLLGSIFVKHNEIGNTKNGKLLERRLYVREEYRRAISQIIFFLSSHGAVNNLRVYFENGNSCIIDNILHYWDKLSTNTLGITRKQENAKKYQKIALNDEHVAMETENIDIHNVYTIKYDDLLAIYKVESNDEYYKNMFDLLANSSNIMNPSITAPFRKLYVKENYKVKSLTTLAVLYKKNVISDLTLFFGGNPILATSLQYWRDLKDDKILVNDIVNLGKHYSDAQGKNITQNNNPMTQEEEDQFMENIKRESLRGGILELGIKNFSTTEHTENLCRWCRTDKAESQACPINKNDKPCDHLLFCLKCLTEYKKTAFVKYCPICISNGVWPLQEITFDTWETNNVVQSTYGIKYEEEDEDYEYDIFQEDDNENDMIQDEK